MKVSERPPFELPFALRAILDALPSEVMLVAWWHDEKSNIITIQDFFLNDERYIPVFTSWEHFDSRFAGTEFEPGGAALKSDLFLSMLKGGELIILDLGFDGEKRIQIPELQ